MRLSHPYIGGALIALALGACSSLPTDRPPLDTAKAIYRPLALSSAGSAGSLRWDEEAQRTYLAVPTRMAAPKSKATLGDRAFSKSNWSYSVKQKDRIQVYIAQTPDWFTVVEQELPRHQRDFNRLEEALAYANERYPHWSLVSLEP